MNDPIGGPTISPNPVAASKNPMYSAFYYGYWDAIREKLVEMVNESPYP